METPTLTIVVSADNPEDVEWVTKLFTRILGVKINFLRFSLLDLLLKEQIGWFLSYPAPDIIIAFYRNWFSDLKVVAELKKRPEFQFRPIYAIVTENIQNTEKIFLKYGVSRVLRMPKDDESRVRLVQTVIHDLTKSQTREGPTIV